MVGFSSPIHNGIMVDTVSIFGCAQTQLIAIKAPRKRVIFLVNMIKNKSILGHDKNIFFVSLGSMTCPGSLAERRQEGFDLSLPVDRHPLGHGKYIKGMKKQKLRYFVCRFYDSNDFFFLFEKSLLEKQQKNDAHRNGSIGDIENGREQRSCFST